MLSITHGEKYTLLHILSHTLITITAIILSFVYGMSGYTCLVTALVFGFGPLSYAWRIYRKYSDVLA